MSSLSPGGLVAVGVVVGLISTCVQSVGLTLQRKSHILEDEKEEHLPKRAPYRRRRWQIGMLLFLLSNIVGSSIQITTLPLPLLSTLQASGLVFNALLASLLLHEPFTKRTALGTVLVAIGAVLISFFSALPEPSHSLDQLLDLLLVKGFLIWMSLTLLLALGIIFLAFFLGHFLPPQRRNAPRIRLLRGMSYGLISGILSAHALLLAKSAVELLVRTIVDKRNQFNRPEAWALLLLFLFLALTQLYYLHHGLKLVSTSILYPFVFCIYNIIAILDGLIYFRQTDQILPLQGGLIALGTVILLTGVLALSWRLSDETASGDEDGYEPGIKADLPHSALTPGLGLVNEDSNDMRTPLRRFFDSPTRPYHDDPSDDEDTAVEEENSEFPDLIDVEGELEPVTRRHTTALSNAAATQSRSTSRRTRRTSNATTAQDRDRRRRSTIKEVQAVWDELRDERNWFPTPPPAQRSPRTITSAPQERYRDDPTTAVGHSGRSALVDVDSPTARPKSAAGGGGGTATGTTRKRVDFTPVLGGRRRTEPLVDSDVAAPAAAAPPSSSSASPLGIIEDVSAAAGGGADSSGSRKEKGGEQQQQRRQVIVLGSSPHSAEQSPMLGSTAGYDDDDDGTEEEEHGNADENGDAATEGTAGAASGNKTPKKKKTQQQSQGMSGTRNESAQRKSWTGSVKLDWWRSKRRDEG